MWLVKVAASTTCKLQYKFTPNDGLFTVAASNPVTPHVLLLDPKVNGIPTFDIRFVGRSTIGEPIVVPPLTSCITKLHVSSTVGEKPPDLLVPIPETPTLTTTPTASAPAGSEKFGFVAVRVVVFTTFPLVAVIVVVAALGPKPGRVKF